MESPDPSKDPVGTVFTRINVSCQPGPSQKVTVMKMQKFRGMSELGQGPGKHTCRIWEAVCAGDFLRAALRAVHALPVATISRHIWRRSSGPDGARALR